MTSQVGWDDIESELWRLGGTKMRPGDIVRWRRMINSYAIGLRQKYDVDHWLPEVKTKRVTAAEADYPEGLRLACQKCGFEGDAAEHFYRKPSYTANYGFDHRCKACANLSRDDTATPKGGYLCRGCVTRKPLKEFPALKQRYPSKMVKCTACCDKANEALVS